MRRRGRNAGRGPSVNVHTENGVSTPPPPQGTALIGEVGVGGGTVRTGPRASSLILFASAKGGGGPPGCRAPPPASRPMPHTGKIRQGDQRGGEGVRPHPCFSWEPGERRGIHLWGSLCRRRRWIATQRTRTHWGGGHMATSPATGRSNLPDFENPGVGSQERH